MEPAGRRTVLFIRADLPAEARALQDDLNRLAEARAEDRALLEVIERTGGVLNEIAGAEVVDAERAYRRGHR